MDSLADLSRIIGIHPNTLYKVRTGDRYPSFQLFYRIISELEMESNDVVDLAIALAEKDPELIDLVLMRYVRHRGDGKRQGYKKKPAEFYARTNPPGRYD